MIINCVTLFDKKGTQWLGRSRDNWKKTFPGGHVINVLFLIFFFHIVGRRFYDNYYFIIITSHVDLEMTLKHISIVFLAICQKEGVTLDHFTRHVRRLRV